MFKSVTRTWPVFVGCEHGCTYCWARPLAEGRLKNNPRYRGGFKPHLVYEELGRAFNPGEFIGVALMGDISFASLGEFLRICARIREFPKTDFLIQSKNPRKICDWYVEWDVKLPANVVFGTTIESNIDYRLTNAPPPYDRFRYLAACSHPRKFLSIEPIMDFNLGVMVRWVEILKPEIIEIGADNYRHSLIEPPWWKVEGLLAELRKRCPRVVQKEGLERLKGGQ